jgi:hypothetical protein
MVNNNSPLQGLLVGRAQEIFLTAHEKYIRALVDTGATTAIVLKAYVNKDRASSYKYKRQSFHTMGGTFETRRKAKLTFAFPELNCNKGVEWSCHVDETNKPSDKSCDVIIGLDRMNELGLQREHSQQSYCLGKP